MTHIIRKIALLAVLSASLIACELDETVFSDIPLSEFYRTGADAEAAITAVYDPMADMFNGGVPFMASDFSADQTYPRAVVGRDVYTLFSYDPTYNAQNSQGRGHESAGQIWRSCYDGIEKANWVIEEVPKISMNQARKMEILGEAYFLRAWYHWMLTKHFGDVIIKTKATRTQEDAFNGASEKAKVYEQIYKDLDSATLKLRTGAANAPDRGRPSREAAYALYAKAALYNEDWAKALAMAKIVDENPYYDLMTNVEDVYDVAQEAAARKENMFSFEGENGELSRWSFVMGLSGPANSNGLEYGGTGGNTFGSWFVYPGFYNSFAANDKRRNLMATSYVARNGQTIPQDRITPITTQGVLIRKYRDTQAIGDRNRVNFPLLRFADVLLIAAEAEARLNGPTTDAYGYINRVRARAGIGDLPAGLSKDEFVAAVLQERSWELFAEADRWFDLTRTNTFLTVIPTATNNVYPTRAPQAKHRYFPIPQQELNANPRLQQSEPWR